MSEPSAKRATLGRPPRLSREALVDAAEAIIERDGFAALTMRRVAHELNSSPMAIYRHVQDRDELLVLLLDRLASRLPRPQWPREPRAKLLTACRLLHDSLAQTPWAVQVLASGDLMGPSVLWLIEEILDALVRCGCSLTDAAQAWRLIWYFIVGELTVSGSTASRTRELKRSPFTLSIYADADPATLPNLAALTSFWPEARKRNSFNDGIDALLTGLLSTQ